MVYFFIFHLFLLWFSKFLSEAFSIILYAVQNVDDILLLIAIWLLTVYAGLYLNVKEPFVLSDDSADWSSTLLLCDFSLILQSVTAILWLQMDCSDRNF